MSDRSLLLAEAQGGRWANMNRIAATLLILWTATGIPVNSWGKSYPVQVETNILALTVNIDGPAGTNTLFLSNLRKGNEGDKLAYAWWPEAQVVLVLEFVENTPSGPALCFMGKVFPDSENNRPSLFGLPQEYRPWIRNIVKECQMSKWKYEFWNYPLTHSPIAPGDTYTGTYILSNGQWRAISEDQLKQK